MALRVCGRSSALVFYMTVACSLASGQSFLFQNTEPRIQLTGEDFQLQSNGVYFTDSVPGRTITNAGVLGADLGFAVTYNDKVYFLFGDTLGTWSGEGKHFLASGSGGDDSIGYIPNVDISGCHYISTVDGQITQGNPKPSVDQSACPAIEFFLNPSAEPTAHKFQKIVINSLEPGDGMGPYCTPSGGIVYNDRLYMFYIVQVQDVKPHHLAIKSIMAKSDQDMSKWTQTSPPTFTRLYTVSSHPPFSNPSDPPRETGETGKFMFNPPVVMSHSDLAANALLAGLPERLQTADNVVLVFGSSYRYNTSNLYLAAFDLDDIEIGASAWFYYAGTSEGKNQWTTDERKAAPLLSGEPNIGNHSVIWNNTLRRFVLMFGNIKASASATPWGPWSDPVLIFQPVNGWSAKLVHVAESSSIKRTVTPIFDSNGAQTDVNSGQRGIPYGPNLLTQSTTNADGSVTLYYTMSTWNPYEVFLTSSTFRIGPKPAPVVSAASFDGTDLAPGSIATITGSNLGRSEESASSPENMPESLGGVSVVVEDSKAVSRQAKLYYVSPGQINFVVPEETAPGPAMVKVMTDLTVIFPAAVNITPTAPALFTANANGNGPPAALVVQVDSDGNETSSMPFTCPAGGGECVSAPIDVSDSSKKTVVELFGTGIRGRAGLQSVAAAVGGAPATVEFAGPQSQYPGLDQVNIVLSPDLQGRGEVDLVLLVDGRAVNTVKLNIQ